MISIGQGGGGSQIWKPPPPLSRGYGRSLLHYCILNVQINKTNARVQNKIYMSKISSGHTHILYCISSQYPHIAMLHGCRHGMRCAVRAAPRLPLQCKCASPYRTECVCKCCLRGREWAQLLRVQRDVAHCRREDIEVVVDWRQLSSNCAPVQWRRGAANC
jgi:hypothetical protein